jgi:hypothetical protein
MPLRTVRRSMTDRRGLAGGVLLVVGALPLALTAGARPIRYLSIGLVAIGVLVSYGAWMVEDR